MKPFPEHLSTAMVEDDDWSLLDLAVLVVDHLKLLVLAPVLGASAVGLGVLLWPDRYESEAIQTGDPVLVAIYKSVGLQETVAQQVHPALLAQDPDEARQKVEKSLKVSFNGKEKTVRLSALGDTPLQAQQLLGVALATAAKINEGRTNEIARLKLQYDTLLLREQEYLQAAKQVTEIIQKNPQGPAVGALTQTQAHMVTAARDSQLAASSVASTLDKLERFELIQAPTLASRPEPKNTLAWMALAAMALALVAIVLLGVRAAWHKAAQDPLSSDKVRRIQAAWAGKKADPAA